MNLHSSSGMRRIALPLLVGEDDTLFWGNDNLLPRNRTLSLVIAVPNSVHDERYQAIIAELRRARIELGLSQAELAATLGRRQQFVSKYESGERRLDIVEHFDIARALKLSPVDIWHRLE